MIKCDGLKRNSVKNWLLIIPSIAWVMFGMSHPATATAPLQTPVATESQDRAALAPSEPIAPESPANPAALSAPPEANVADLISTPEPSKAPMSDAAQAPGLSPPPIETLEADLQDKDTDTSALDPNDLMGQVTAVSQLSDVQPTDWAFQSLQSLVERYGCIAGYPDQSYRGNRAMTRYEFAAGVNACLDRISELIASGTANLVTKADLQTLQRLAEEYATELATLRGRVDAVETRTAQLEATQFSTTTKLNGLVFFNLTGAFANGTIKAEGLDVFTSARDPITNQPVVRTIANNPNITFSNQAYLILNTSFTGKDSLLAITVLGNGFSPANQFASAGELNIYGVPFSDFNPAQLFPNRSAIVFRELSYGFPLTDAIRVTVGPRIDWYRYFDYNVFNNYLAGGTTSFNSTNSPLFIEPQQGAGALVQWKFTPELSLNMGYLGESNYFIPNNGAVDPNKGLFNGSNSITAELVYSPSATANIRFLYARTNMDTTYFSSGQVFVRPILGVADDGFGGPLGNATADFFSTNFDWLITPAIGVFGRYTYASNHLFPLTPGRPAGDLNVQSFQAGLAFPDLGKKGAQVTLSYLIPFAILNGRNFLASGGGNGGVQYELEAAYFYPINDFIALTPSFYAIINPNNFSDNPAVFVGSFRTQFSF